MEAPKNHFFLNLNEAFQDFPTYESTPYNVEIDTNETNILTTLNTMKEDITGNTLIAVSGFFGLNIAAARGKDKNQSLNYLVFIDRSSCMKKLWENVIPIVKENEKYDDALLKIKNLLKEKAKEFWPQNYQTKEGNLNSTQQAERALKILDRERLYERSWLSTQTHYDVVKNIVDKDNFVFKLVDLFNPEQVKTLAATIKKIGELQIDVCYLSNVREFAEIHQYVEKQKKFKTRSFDGFKNSLPHLTQIFKKETLVIDTDVRYGGILDGTELIQRIVKDVTQELNRKKLYCISPGTNF